LKFYLPLAARIEKLSLGTEVLDSGQYQLESRAQHQLLTLRLRVKANSEQSLELIYLIPHDLQEPFSYVFLDQKQAGIFNKETTYRVLFAESFQPELIAPAAIYENKVIEFENKNDNNFLFAVAF